MERLSWINAQSALPTTKNVVLILTPPTDDHFDKLFRAMTLNFRRGLERRMEDKILAEVMSAGKHAKIMSTVIL